MNFSESSFNECLFFLFFRTGSARLGGLMAIPKCSKQQDLFYYLQFAPLKKKKVGMQEWICPIKLTQLQRHCCLPLSLLTSARAVGFISTMVPNVTPIFEESGLLVFLINHCNYLARHHQEEPWIVTRLHLSCVQKKTWIFAGKASKEELISLLSTHQPLSGLPMLLLFPYSVPWPLMKNNINLCPHTCTASAQPSTAQIWAQLAPTTIHELPGRL